MRRNQRVFAALAGAAMIVIALVATVLLRSSGDDPAAAALAAEFADAYPSEATPTGVVREFDLTAEPASIAVFGGSLTDVWSYNGVVPGPQLRVELGETISVELTNALPQSTSIHWHGIRVPNAMDGVPGLNQAPVEPGATFRYEFTPPDAGTFWFHSHTRGSEQLERGLYGSLVVTDPAEPVYSQDVVWVIDDWFLDEAGRLDENFNNAHETTHNGRWGNVVTTNGAVNPALEARPGDRLRLRLINASNARTYTPNFGGLDARLIAVDGMLVREIGPADDFVLSPGARIDVDLTLPVDEVDVAVTENFNGEGYTLGRIVTSGPVAETPSFDPPSNPLVPRWAGAVDADVDQDYSLDFIESGRGPEWGFNDKTFADTETYKVRQGEFQKVRLSNPSQSLHPIHIHGQFFKVVAIDGQPVDEGHFRDTVLLFPQQVIDIALVAFDVGQWAVHCHIQEHADAGMMTILEVEPALD